MIKFNPENKDELTIGEIFSQAQKIKTKEEAKQYLDDYISHIMKETGKDYNYASRTAKDNLGYYAGYYNETTNLRIQELFEVEHPIFGKGIPTPEEAWEAGKKWSRCKLLH
jgi:hypothetical protein